MSRALSAATARATVDLLIGEARVAVSDATIERAMFAAERAVDAAEQLDDPGLLVRALQLHMMVLRYSGDNGAALVRCMRILAMAQDPAIGLQLGGLSAAWAIADAYMEFAVNVEQHGQQPVREVLGVLDAAEEWLTATGHSDWRGGILLRRAQVYRVIGDNQEALRFAAESLAAYKSDAPGYTLASHRSVVGSCLAETGRASEAMVQFQAILDDPDSSACDRAGAHLDLARVSLAAGQVGRASRHAEMSAQLAEGCGQPVASRALRTLASVRRAAGDLPKARDAADRALAAARRGSSNYALYFGTRMVIEIALDQEDLAAALGLIDELDGFAGVLDKARGSAELGQEAALMRLLLTICAAPGLPDARHCADLLARFSDAIAAQPRSEWALAGRGEVYRRMGRRAEAAADFRRAVDLEPAFGWAIARLGEAERG